MSECETKVSPLGALPLRWEIRTLKSLCTKIGSGATPRGGQDVYLNERESHALIRSQHVYDHYFDETGVVYITEDHVQELRNVEVQSQDLLLNITGDGITFARVCMVPYHVLPACVNQHVAIIRTNSSVCEPGYLLGYLTLPSIKTYIESFNSGGSRRAITKVAPFETTFLIPLRNGLTKPRSVRGSGFYMVNMGELFGNKRIGDLEMDRVELSDSEYEKSLLEVGDILFARQSLVREGAGQCSIITEAPEPRTFEGHLIRCRIDRKKANPFYFFYHFWSFAGGFQMRSLVEQVAAAGIRGSELAKLEMLIPPVERQDKFFTVIEPLEKSIALNFRRIRTLTKTRDVLLPKLMSGKLRITE